MIEDLLIIICKDGATRKEITTTLLLFGIEQQEINSLFNRLYYLKKIHELFISKFLKDKNEENNLQ